mmetsp:Transcript_15590/g.40007  ORF Transcript_15590/g.40007 Transcript_15590/m.40007 type:complete len:344 (-) Transcript_15590:128-1159(-)
MLCVDSAATVGSPRQSVCRKMFPPPTAPETTTICSASGETARAAARMVDGTDSRLVRSTESTSPYRSASKMAPQGAHSTNRVSVASEKWMSVYWMACPARGVSWEKRGVMRPSRPIFISTWPPPAVLRTPKYAAPKRPAAGVRLVSRSAVPLSLRQAAPAAEQMGVMSRLRAACSRPSVSRLLRSLPSHSAVTVPSPVKLTAVVPGGATAAVASSSTRPSSPTRKKPAGALAGSLSSQSEGVAPSKAGRKATSSGCPPAGAPTAASPHVLKGVLVCTLRRPALVEAAAREPPAAVPRTRRNPRVVAAVTGLPLPVSAPPSRPRGVMPASPCPNPRKNPRCKLQ